ncbi:MAG: hypothetical protein E7515_05460 [Ruminococcaceae bacterium]|nr:hypothetical protein [Oscillospiraceae bacterium]
MSENKKKTASLAGIPLVILGVILCFYAAISGSSEDKPSAKATASMTSEITTVTQAVTYGFKNKKSLNDHFEKHGADTYCKTAEEYLEKANAVINNPDALTKIESDEGDGDRIFYIEETDEIVFLSTDGFIRTYFICSGKDYFDRQ